ncbi:MAG: polysaccharide biosynthesis C-terminal domain-containing protein [Hyphomicrobiales bacterium]
MQKKFLSNLILVLFLNLLVKPVYIFFIDRGVQNAVGTVDYGFYFNLLNYVLILNIILDLGITNYNNRNIAQNSQLLSKHFSGIIVLRLFLGLAYVITTLFISIFYYHLDILQIKVLLLLGVNQFLVSFTLYLRSNISGLLLFRTDSLISVLDRLLLIIICGFLLLNESTRLNFNILWFVYAQTFAYACTTLTALVVVLRKVKGFKIKFNYPFYLMIIKQSFPLALLVFLMGFYLRSDALFLKRMLDNGDYYVGVYAAAFRIFEAGNNISFLMAGLLLPLFSKMLKNKDSVERIVKLSFTMVIVSSMLVAVISTFYDMEIMSLLYGKGVSESSVAYQIRIKEIAQAFSIIMIGFIPVSGSYIFGTLLTANGSFKILNWIAFASVIVSFSLNILLIPHMQATGACIANVSACMLSLILQLIVTRKLFHFSFGMKYLLKIASYIFIIFVLGYYSKYISSQWLVNLIVLVFLSIGLALTLRLIKVKAFFQILKEKD